MTNEKLIEEAAKAIRTQTLHGLRADHPEFYHEIARAALAVFEKSHPPTTPTGGEREALAWDRGYEAGARNERSNWWGPVVNPFRRSEVSEPTGGLAQAIADGGGIMPLVKPQGEPSDTQVNYALAALRKAHYRAWREITPDAMRAALRAASAVTEPEENR